MEKHTGFYRVVEALVRRLEHKFTHVLVFDMHSYNRKRWDRDVPVWNLGTANIDVDRFGELTEYWSQKLSSMAILKGKGTTSSINDIFQGNGYFLKYITSNFENTLVLATEISKIYCNEHTGITFPEVVRSLENQLKVSIPEMVKEFQRTVK